MEIKVVDVDRIGLCNTSPSDEDYQITGDDLFRAFEKVGFVYITGHGVSKQTIEQSMEKSRAFFNLPIQKKKQMLRDPEIQQGYVEAGMELFNSKEAFHEIRESYEVTKIEGKHATFPDDDVPGMRNALTDLASQSKELTFRLLRSIAMSLGQDKEFFVRCHQKIFTPECITKLRSLYYPPITGSVQPGVVRCGEHSDYGLITLLYQDEIGGLEVKGVNNTWTPANPIKDAVLINAGDMLEMFTNGSLPATLHRVIIPEEEIKKRTSRQSIVFFVHPDHETMISPLPTYLADQDKSKAMIEEERAASKTKEFTNGYKPISALDHVNKRFAATYLY